MSKKNKGFILLITVGILSVISWSIFTCSFVIRKQIKKIGINKLKIQKDKKEKLEKNIYKIYMKSIEKKIQEDIEIENISDYLLKKDKMEIWTKNYGNSFILTDSNYYIDEIYIKRIEETDSHLKKIYIKGTNKNNYFQLIKNFSYINRFNMVRIKLKKEIKNFRIGEDSKYQLEIYGKVDIKYFFKGDRYPLENIEKSKGDIDVKIF
ncbi:hypothetical protein [Fusobacterium sp.]|uniref:hypothetical protein n=1 Tax=Fusobacterium sp. TaxID=68766 RepID=UPI002614E8E2|nr:hypothetical protein [Fusobacterium sp.]